MRTFQFRFVPAGGNCYGQTPGFIDGLAYDEGASLADSDDSLWISDDAGFKLHQVDLQGNLIASFTVPKNPRSGNAGCNTGIAVDGEFLWLALQSGADQQPHDIVQVSKSDPTKVVRSFAFSNTNIPGPEGLALDTVTIPGVAALWTNQFGSSNRLRLWEIRPSGLVAGWGGNNSVSFVSEPVNTATGNYFYQRSDLVLPGRGVPFIFTRSYNSQDSYAGPLGHGWTHSFNVLLEENPGDGLVRIKQADGHTDFYTSTGGGNYAPQFRGVFDSLVKNGDGTFTLTKKNQTLYQFSPSGKLMNVIDRNGNSLSLTYDAPGNLRKIMDTVGRTVDLSYNPSNRIRELTDPIGRTVRYSYDASENLASVTDPSGGVIAFAYDVDHRLLEIRDERGNLLVAN